ncbi:MAG: hypothetical protein KUG72_03770 [Pseudomonadales bacterium]|nr:hypothetical protein [Pseudomonadales bacterium]
MLLRILFLIAIVGLVLFLLKRGKGAPDSPSTQSPIQKKAADSDAELIVPCEQCGLHLPKSEAIQEGKVFFCSEQHQQLSNK